MAQDYLLRFGSTAFSAQVAIPVPTYTNSYVTGPAAGLIGSVIDLGGIGGNNSKSDLFAKVSVNATAVGSTSGDTTTYWTFNPVVEASKDGTNYSVVSTLPVDVNAFKIAYATASTISGDSSIQMFVPLYAPAGVVSTQFIITGGSDPRGALGLAVSEDNYRFFRVRLCCRAFGAGSSHTFTGNVTAAIVNAKDGII
jgi:hypothetical protein